MFELARLIRSYLDGELDYATFRREFVVRFLAVRSDDEGTDAVVVETESLCADLAEGQIASEASLKDALRQKLWISAAAPVILGKAKFCALESSGTSSRLQAVASMAVSGSPQVLPETVFS
jgi:hypothetical protein